MYPILLDTNIYGKIFADKEGAQLARRIRGDRSLFIPNFRLIRNELRRAQKILPLYDELVSRRVIDENNDIRNLAREYFEEYRKSGGVQGQKKIMNDFKIVACATLLNCDIRQPSKRIVSST